MNQMILRFAVDMFFMDEDEEDDKHTILQKVVHFAEEIVPNFSSRQFKSHFRMDPATFEELLAAINAVDDTVYRSGNPETLNEKQLMIAIWYLANIESFRCVADRFGLSSYTAWSSLYKICRKLLVINARHNIIAFPSKETCNIIMNSFKNRTGFPGKIGAIDVSHIPIVAPRVNHAAYVNRKGDHSVLLQAVCDHRKKFIDCYAGEVGSNHDACVYRRSPLGHNIRHRNLANNGHLVGDTAYPLATYLLTPYKDNGHLTNISKTRVVIEHTFALLKGRFRRLKLLETIRLDLVSLIIMSCCILHNICIDADDFIDVDLAAELAEERLLQPMNPHLALPVFNDAEAKRNNIAYLLFAKRN